MYTYLFIQWIHLALQWKPAHSIVKQWYANKIFLEKPTVSWIQVPSCLRTSAMLAVFMQQGLCPPWLPHPSLQAPPLTPHVAAVTGREIALLSCPWTSSASETLHILFTHLKVCLWEHTQTQAHTHTPLPPLLPCTPCCPLPKVSFDILLRVSKLFSPALGSSWP